MCTPWTVFFFTFTIHAKSWFQGQTLNKNVQISNQISCADFYSFSKKSVFRKLLFASIWDLKRAINGLGREDEGRWRGGWGAWRGAESRWRGAEGWPANSEGSHCPHFSRLPRSKFSSVAATQPSSVIQQPVNNFFTLFSLNMDLPSLLFTWGWK